MPEPDPQEPHPQDEPDQDRSFADLAVDKGLVTRPQVDEALKAQKTIIGLGLKRSLSEILIEKGLLTQAQAEAVNRSIEAGADVKFVAGYELIEKLGEGGMGVVYKANQISLDRTVALKILPERLGRDREFVGRFTREARMAARLDHVNIVRALDVGEAQGMHYFAMEFVEGEDVGSLIDREGKMSEERSVDIIMQAARALAHAHEHQLIHRDIKPDNILVTKQGITKVADLGLARSTDEQVTRMTVTGTAMGTPHYISPEQARGQPDIDIRTDIYSLGVTFFHMVAGQPPFQGSSAAIVITRRLTEDPPWVRDAAPEVSEGAALVIRKMMERERDNRYSAPAELIHDLELIADGKMPEIAAGAPGTVMWGAEQVEDRKGAGVALPGRAAAPAWKRLSPLAWAAIAGGGAVALFLVVLIVALLMGPAGEGPGGDADALARKELAKIDGLAKKGEIEAAMRACETAKSSYEGTPHAQTFAARLADLKLAQARAERETAAKDRLAAILADREAGRIEEALARARDARSKYADTSVAGDLRKQLAELERIAPLLREVESRLIRVKDLEEAGALGSALSLARTSAEELGDSGLAGPLVEAAKRVEAKVNARKAEELAREAEKELEAIAALVRQAKLEEALARAEAAATKFAATPSAERIKLLALQTTERIVEDIAKGMAERERAKKAAARAKELVADAGALMKQKRFAEAADAYEKALKTSPSDEASKGLAEARFRMHMQRSVERERALDLGAAIEEIRKALAVKADVAASTKLSELERQLKVARLTTKGMDLMAGGSNEAALEPFRQALALALPGAQKDEIRKAIGRLEKAVAYDEAMREARGHVSAERWRQAEGAAARALEAKPGDAVALRLLATIRQAMGTSARPPTPPGGRPPEGPRETRKTASSTGMKFVLVPAGSYTMGGERGQPDEKPIRRVKLSAFYIGLTEVTNAEYERFDPRHRRRRSEFSPGDDHPAVNVSWSDAARFCKWLSKKERGVFRLATEAEWEAAARGAEARRFPWGSGGPDAGGVYRANWGEGDDRAGWARDGFRHAAPVGSFPAGASSFGCLDMAGNVWEWCGDWYSAGYYAKGELEDPTGPRRGSERVLRGGAFANDIEIARSANRHKTVPRRADPTIGFRVVMEVKPGR